MGNSSGNIAGPKLFECSALGNVALAHVHVQDVDRTAVAGHQGLNPPPGPTAPSWRWSPTISTMAGVGRGLQQPKQEVARCGR